MGFLDNLGKPTGQAPQSTPQVVPQGVPQAGGSEGEGARLTKQIDALRQAKEQTYKQLGQRYEALFGGAPAPELAEFFQTLRSLDEQIKESEKQRRALKGLVLCENCGAEQSITAVFCSCCGSRLAAEDAVICPVCHNAVPEGADFCVNCGTRVQAKEPAGGSAEKCPKCGALVSEGTVFCGTCGARLIPEE